MSTHVKILGIGDVVGTPGRLIIRNELAKFCEKRGVGFVVCNAENIDKGAGVKPSDADELVASGVHVITCGDHVWNKKELIPYIEKHAYVLRPVNYPSDQPGRGWTVHEVGGVKVGVVHIQGNVFMKEPAANPFRAADAAIEEIKKQTPIVVIDMHCEATSEKIAMGWHTDGRASFVFGTHTHVQTADDRVLPKGTAYITDLGMTGPYESVIGRQIDRVLTKFTTGMPAYFEVATGDVRLSGAVATIDVATGRAEAIERVMFKSGEMLGIVK